MLILRQLLILLWRNIYVHNLRHQYAACVLEFLVAAWVFWYLPPSSKLGARYPGSYRAQENPVGVAVDTHSYPKNLVFAAEKPLVDAFVERVPSPPLLRAPPTSDSARKMLLADKLLIRALKAVTVHDIERRKRSLSREITYVA